MLRYLCKRVLSTIPVLFLVSIVVFSMIHLTPGSPARSMLGPEATEEQVAALEEVMGLNDPLPVQYVNWISDLLHGDFGVSVSGNEPVLSMIVSHMGPTISVTVFALIIDLLIALPLGILAARKKGGRGRPACVGGVAVRRVAAGLFAGPFADAALRRPPGVVPVLRIRPPL